MTTIAYRTQPGIVAHVVPFDDMTPEQQVDHLIYGHGFDKDYFDSFDETDPDGVTSNAQVRTMMLAWGDLAGYHADDHSDYALGGADGCRHQHNKAPSTVTVTRQQLLDTAASLLDGPEDLDESSPTTEYVRGMVELIGRATGQGFDEDLTIDARRDLREVWVTGWLAPTPAPES